MTQIPDQEKSGCKSPQKRSRSIDTIQDCSVSAKMLSVTNNMSADNRERSPHEKGRADEQTKTKEKTNDHLGIIPGLSCLGDQCFKGENKLDNPEEKAEQTTRCLPPGSRISSRVEWLSFHHIFPRRNFPLITRP